MRRPQLLVAALLVVTITSAASAQSSRPAEPPAPVAASGTTTANHVVSANPFGLLLELFNAEYELRSGRQHSFAIGGSTAQADSNYTDANGNTTRERYVNGDVIVRFYPGGRVFQGASFGLKAGLTSFPGEESHFGYGFDMNYSWVKNNFYFGAGGGLKKLVGVDDALYALEYIPTLRLNVGIGF